MYHVLGISYQSTAHEILDENVKFCLISLGKKSLNPRKSLPSYPFCIRTSQKKRPLNSEKEHMLRMIEHNVVAEIREFEILPNASCSNTMHGGKVWPFKVVSHLVPFPSKLDKKKAIYFWRKAYFQNDCAPCGCRVTRTSKLPNDLHSNTLHII